MSTYSLVEPEGNHICGIVGIAASSLNKAGKDIFSDLMIVSNVRGRWGAGVAAVVDDKIRGAKSLYSGCDLLDMKGYNELIKENKIRVLLGHTRWPTKGAAEYINVHPHFNTNITGVHNGTLDKVAGEYVKGEESDSVLFYRNADEVGFEKALARTNGAYCFVFIDHDTQTLNFIRNNQRPLFIGKHLWGTDSQSLIWASEKEMITFAMGRANMLGKLEIIELPTNELWTIPYNVKKGVEFEIKKNLFGGSDLWRPLGNPKPVSSSTEGGWPFRGGNFRKGTGVDRNATPTSTTSVGKETYVFRGGRFVAKSSILSDEPKQVSLRRSEDVNELQGKETLRLPDRSGTPKGASEQQRRKAPKEVSLGNSGAAFVDSLIKGVEKHLSKDEQEFNAEVESEFEKLLAQKVDDTGSQLWEDCQFEDGAERYRETIKGVWVPESEYKELLSFGCAWLGDPANDGDDIYWIDRDTFIFSHCLNDKECVNELRQIYPNDPLFLTIATAFKKNVSPQHITVQ